MNEVCASFFRESCHSARFHSFGPFTGVVTECGLPSARLGEEFPHAGFPCWTPDRWYPLKRKLEEEHFARLRMMAVSHRGSRYQRRGPKFSLDVSRRSG